jgi:hypothetical protein
VAKAQVKSGCASGLNQRFRVDRTMLRLAKAGDVSGLNQPFISCPRR